MVISEDVRLVEGGRERGPRTGKGDRSSGSALALGSSASLQVVADVAEVARHPGADELDGDDRHDGDEGDEEAVLDHGRATVVLDELRLEPGLENEQIHGCLRVL